jgi:hypothetical protein
MDRVAAIDEALALGWYFDAANTLQPPVAFGQCLLGSEWEWLFYTGSEKIVPLYVFNEAIRKEGWDHSC